MAEIASRMSLRSYCGYYSIDAILFAERDLVPNIPIGTTWVRRVAFEHENDFNSGLFQEVSESDDAQARVSRNSNPQPADPEVSFFIFYHRVLS
jgi:hypothetical protein